MSSPNSHVDEREAGQETRTAAEGGLCPVVEAVDEIGSQWRLTVLYELQNGEYRFNELKRATDANARTLSRVLDELQDLGLINRRLEEESPVATYYTLTEKGRALCPVFDELQTWGDEWALDCQDDEGES